MGKLNYLIFCVLVLLVIVVSHVECGAQECEISKTGSTFKNVLDIDDESSLISNKKKHSSHAKVLSKKKLDFNSMTTQQIIDSSLTKYNGEVGPSDDKYANQRIYQARNINNNKVMDKMGNRIDSRERERQELGPICIACRINCMKIYKEIGNPIFTSCKKQFYYYGCRKADGCYKVSTATDDKIKGMLGICLLRNGCKLASLWKAYGTDDNVRDTLVRLIRDSKKTPEL